MKPNRKKTWIITGVALVVVLAVTVSVALYLRAGQLERALRPEQYRRVQVTLTQKQELAEGVTLGDMPDVGGTASEQTSTPAEPREISVMKKDGDRIYEEGLGGKYYFYPRAGKDYVLVYDDMSGALAQGEWIEAPAEQFTLRPVFSFARLADYASSSFQRKGNTYRPDYVHLADVFFGLLQISEQTMDRYADYTVELEIKKGRLHTITATYLFDKTYRVEQVYTFAYANEAVTPPAPTAAAE